MNQINIQTFLTLTKTGSLTKTAELLFVSQPTVSNRLKELEKELGVDLLLRGKGWRRVELTQKGEEFIPIAEQWLALMAESTKLQNQENEYFIRIGCPDTLNSTVLRGFYSQMMDDPELDLKLKISTHYSYNIYDLLEQHAIDIGFVFHLLHFKNIITETLVKEKMVVVRNAREDEADRPGTGGSISLNELDPSNEVCFIWDNNYQLWHDQMISKGRRCTLEVDGFNLLNYFLFQQGKWAIVPVSVAGHLGRRQNLSSFEIADKRKPPERITYIIQNKNLSETRKQYVNVLKEKVIQYYKNYFASLNPEFD